MSDRVHTWNMCKKCREASFFELVAFINDLTRNHFQMREYVDKQSIDWKVKEIEKRFYETRCECSECHPKCECGDC